MKPYNCRLSWFILTALLIPAAPKIRSDQFNVDVDGFGFHPSYLAIHTGDTVFFYNNDEDDYSHSSTSNLSPGNANYWNIELFDYTDIGYHGFSNPGTFTYRDKYDIGTGTIVVTDLPKINLANARGDSGQYLFDATGLIAGKSYDLLYSTNLALTEWIWDSTAVATGASMTFTNAISSEMRCYRLMQEP